jgi:outer membrane biosynthesis protein TonB
VLSTATGKVEEILETTSARFATTLTSTTSEVANVLSNTGNLVTDALKASSSGVTERLAEFRTAAESETEKASDSLRQTQQTMILEMQQALEEATRRFNDTAAAMRQIAKEVGTELEATRSELARGVMELPEETRTSAAAMRRVVAEQIEALSELNAIVRAQSATHDLSDRRPTPPPAPRAEPRPEPVRVAETPRPAPAPAKQPTPRTVTIAEAPRVVAAPVAEAPKPAAPAPAKTEDAGGGGWLRDVLRNANAPAPAAPAAAPAQNLTSLTDEIARAIDPAALGEAWQQYQMGEQNVFSRRIYTLTGQSTFDQVKRRLGSDADFMKNAASYMQEFEALLQRAAQGGDPVGETRAILISDRGKVYTMLAHASGRLG